MDTSECPWLFSVYEIIRQKKRNLTMAGKTAVHDLGILVGAGCVNRVEVAYSFGHELRGLSPASRRMVESGQCKVVAENQQCRISMAIPGGYDGYTICRKSFGYMK